MQPAILSNGTMGIWLTRLSDDHGITKLALQNQSLDQFLDALFLKLLTRHPTAEEKTRYTQYLSPGYDMRAPNPQSQSGNRRSPPAPSAVPRNTSPGQTISTPKPPSCARNRNSPAVVVIHPPTA